MSRKLIDSINLQSTKSVTDLGYIFCQSYYIISTMATALIQAGKISFDQNIFTVINDLKKNENPQIQKKTWTNSSEKNMDTIKQYVKIKVKRFKENILQNLRNNIKEIFDREFTIFQSICEEPVQTSSVRYNKQIDHLQNELKTNDNITG